MQTVAGIDMGTQSIKVVLYDWESKKAAAVSRRDVDIIEKNDGTREQKVEWWNEALDQCFEDFSAEERRSIAAIGISGHQHGFVPLDERGRALYHVKLWNDTTTAPQCDEITKKAGGDEAVIAEVLNLMLPGFTAPKILWLKQNKPEAFAKLRYVMLPHDYLNYVFTGEYKAECGDASGMAVFDGAGRRWSRKICDIIDQKLYDILPPIMKSADPAGFVTDAAAARFGIPAGIPVSSGGGDNMMAAIGTGTVEDGFLTMSLGTSGTLFGYSDTPISDPVHGLSGFNSSTGGYLPLLCTMNCTVATEEIRDLFAVDLRELNRLAENSTPGADGVVVLPFFNGERTPNLPNGRASILGLTAANCTRENIARAALESAIFGMKGGLLAFQTLGFHAREIRIAGGGSNSPLWRQIAADILNLPVKRPENPEAAAMGAAIQALWCLLKFRGNPQPVSRLTAEHVRIVEEDTCLPDPANVPLYESAYREYEKYLKALSPLYQ
ncbi:MAG: xylulokinase [Fusobacteriaceae bacterium]|jgi:xylulokinase|nr:xylulokinase [Fusobacteriaceae bacterium]